MRFWVHPLFIYFLVPSIIILKKKKGRKNMSCCYLTSSWLHHQIYSAFEVQTKNVERTNISIISNTTKK